jgi:hypothetical protein
MAATKKELPISENWKRLSCIRLLHSGLLVMGTSTAQQAVRRSLSLSSRTKAHTDTATFFLPDCPKQKKHKLVRHFYKRLGHCRFIVKSNHARAALQEWELQ